MRRTKRRIARIIILAGIAALLMAGCSKKKDYVEASADIADSFPIKAVSAGENPQMVSSSGPYAILHTTAGDVTILLYPEQAPKAVENFIGLAREGYYDGSLFFFVKRDQLSQVGKPASAEVEETSIWGEPFEDQIENGLYNFKGAVGMADMGKHDNLSQFYLLVDGTIPNDDRIIPASMYMHEVVVKWQAVLEERMLTATLSDAELEQFELDVNEEVQSIATKWMPAEAEARFRPVKEQYEKFGGSWALDYNYTVFGQIVEGLNVAEAITQVKVEAATRQPKKDVVIESIEIRE